MRYAEYQNSAADRESARSVQQISDGAETVASAKPETGVYDAVMPYAGVLMGSIVSAGYAVFRVRRKKSAE